MRPLISLLWTSALSFKARVDSSPGWNGWKESPLNVQYLVLSINHNIFLSEQKSLICLSMIRWVTFKVIKFLLVITNILLYLIMKLCFCILGHCSHIDVYIQKHGNQNSLSHRNIQQKSEIGNYQGQSITKITLLLAWMKFNVVFFRQLN